MPFAGLIGDNGRMGQTLPEFEVHLSAVEAGVSAPDLLAPATGLSRQRIKHAMQSGALWITRRNHTQRLRRAKRKLRPRDELHLYYDAEILAEVPPKPQLIADKNSYSVWLKPRGMRSQGSKWGDHCTLVRWAEQHLAPERPAFTVHRLDRAATGLMLVAHSKKMARALSKLFADRKIDKTYAAWVRGQFPAEPEIMRIEDAIDDKRAVSEVTVREVLVAGNCSLVGIRIETGRKHQIRRHLAGAGRPVLGDRLYGNGLHDGVDLQLAAVRLEFECPVDGGNVIFSLPEEGLSLLEPGTRFV